MISDRVLRRVIGSDALVARGGDLFRAGIVATVGIVAGVWLMYYAALVRLMFVDLHMNDFGKFYYSARAFLAGGNMYGPTAATLIPVGAEMRQFWNMNPPHFHLVILPLAFLNPGLALITWWIVSAVALVMAVRIIANELRFTWSWSRLAWTVFGVLICSVTGVVIVTGQVTFPLMLLVTVAWRAARRLRWTKAAIYLGVAASVKPFLFIFWAYLLVTGRIRAWLAMTASAVACLAVGVSVFGWHSYVAWWKVLSAVDWTWAPMNGSIQGLLARSLAPSPLFVPVLNAPKAVEPIAAVLTALVAGVGLIVFARRRSPREIDRQFAGMLATAQLISPLGWVYYLWLMAGPMVGAWRNLTSRVWHWRDRFVVIAVPGLILPLFMTTLWRDRLWAAPTIGSLYTWTTLFLWLALVFPQPEDSTSRPFGADRSSV